MVGLPFMPNFGGGPPGGRAPVLQVNCAMHCSQGAGIERVFLQRKVLSIRYYDTLRESYRLRPRYVYGAVGLALGFALGLMFAMV